MRTQVKRKRRLRNPMLAKRRKRSGSAAPKRVRRRRKFKYANAASSHWRRWGRKAGMKDAAVHSITKEVDKHRALNELWLRRLAAVPGSSEWTWKRYRAAAKGYVEGYMTASGARIPDWLLLPTSRHAGAVISVMNEERTIAAVLGELNRLPLAEIIVVVNGSADGTLNQVRKASNAIIVHYPEPLGYDVGRAVGAKISSADILLFLDGDIPVDAERLIPFIGSVSRGADVALNNISPYLSVFSQWDDVTVMKRFLNETLGRPDLGANSLAAMPHAISRQALERIGTDSLAVPPTAHAKAIEEKLRITLPESVNIVSPNKKRSGMKGKRSPVARMIVGDHVEALHTAMNRKGKRLGYPDRIRNRKYAGGNL